MSQYASVGRFQNGTGDFEEVDLEETGSTVKEALLFGGLCGRRRRMLGEVLSHLGCELLHPGTNVFVEGLDNSRYALVANRLVVGIVAAPDGSACLRIVYVNMDIETRHKGGFVNFIERFQVGAHDEVAFSITARAQNRAVLLGRAQIADQEILHHVGRRLGPTLELVSSKFYWSRAINDSIVAVQMRSDGPGDKQGDGKLRGRLSGGRRRDVEHIVFRGTRAATS